MSENQSFVHNQSRKQQRGKWVKQGDPNYFYREPALLKERLPERAAGDKEAGFGDSGSLFHFWLLRIRKQS